MHFHLFGEVSSEITTGLTRHGHTLHTLADLGDHPQATELAAPSPELLMSVLEQKQWNCLTADGEFLRRFYEEKIIFPYLIIHVLPTALNDATAVDRLFERYPRLTPRRMYTITPSRIKIRQLPGLPG